MSESQIIWEHSHTTSHHMWHQSWLCWEKTFFWSLVLQLVGFSFTLTHILGYLDNPITKAFCIESFVPINHSSHTLHLVTFLLKYGCIPITKNTKWLEQTNFWDGNSYCLICLSRASTSAARASWASLVHSIQPCCRLQSMSDLWYRRTPRSALSNISS